MMVNHLKQQILDIGTYVSLALFAIEYQTCKESFFTIANHFAVSPKLCIQSSIVSVPSS